MKNIEYKQDNDVIIVNINDDLPLKDYLKFDKKNKINELITNSALFFDQSITSNNLFVNPKIIYSLKKDNVIYNIVNTENKIKIIQRKYVNDGIDEASAEIDLINEEFQINKMHHDKTGSTKIVKIHKKHCDVFEGFKLDKKEALDIARDILTNTHNTNLNRYIDTDDVFYRLRILPNDDYNYVIEDDNIALSVRKKNINKIDNLGYRNLDIILKNTKEHVGNIDYTSSYEVSYYINEDFRRKHYATNALKLLIKLLKQKNKDIELTLVALNEISELVIKNNNGKYEEMIPYTDDYYPMYSIKI